MPVTRRQAKQEQDQPFPPPSAHDLPCPPNPTKKKAKKKKAKKKAVNDPPNVPSSSHLQQPSQPSQIPPPPRASLEELARLYQHPSDDARRAANALKQSEEAQASKVFGPPRPSRCTPSQRKRWRQIFASELEGNTEHYATLIEVANSFADTALCSLVQSRIHTHPDLPPPMPHQSIISWLFDLIRTHSGIPARLLGAIKTRNKRREGNQIERRNVGVSYRVFKTPTSYAQFHATVVRLWLSALPKGSEYPPRAHWVAESQEVYDMCLPFLENQRLADSRGRRYPHPPRRVGSPPVTNELVGSVVRNFSKSESLLEWVCSIVQEGVDTRKSVRLEDSGSLVLIGFTAGARSRPLFGLARNLLRKSTDTTDADIRNAAASAYFWKHRCDFPRLDPNWPYSNALSGDINLPSFAGDSLTFSDIEFGPGCMVFAQRYARPMHYEFQPHDWSVMWTTLRDGTNPGGNNFFMANYGVCVKQAADTSITWKPKQYHTSGLGTWDPHNSWARGDDPVMNQQNMAYVTSNRVEGVWVRWADENIPAHLRFAGAMSDLEEAWESEALTN
ncbi:hypothetical protein BKA70DRAFT_1433773 [Coprinopsis sp. MPI-PUGE-AT-0042]|nr:hypothetical protein BKA70DRAFT_1433773 [Coprinopsis sp. MPI-PUGE-AT-0042]